MTERISFEVGVSDSLADDGSAHELLIERSVAKLLGIVAGAFAFSLLSLAIGEQWIETRRHSQLTTLVGRLAFIFFVVAALVALYRLAFGPKFPIRLRSSGILDRRYFHSEIDWRDVVGLGVSRVAGGSFLLVLNLSASGREKLEWNRGYSSLGRLRLLTRGNGVYVPTNDLKISRSQLETEIRRFLAKENPSAL